MVLSTETCCVRNKPQYISIALDENILIDSNLHAFEFQYKVMVTIYESFDLELGCYWIKSPRSKYLNEVNFIEPNSEFHPKRIVSSLVHLKNRLCEKGLPIFSNENA